MRHERVGDMASRLMRERETETERDRERMRSSAKSPYTPSASSYARTVIHPWRDQGQGVGSGSRLGGVDEAGDRVGPGSSGHRGGRESGRGGAMDRVEERCRVTQPINFLNDVTSHSSLPSEQSLLTADTMMAREREREAEKGERVGGSYARWSKDGGEYRDGRARKGVGMGSSKGESREKKGDPYEH